MHHFAIPIACKLTNKERERIKVATRQLPLWHEFWGNKIQRGDTVVDLGANIGLYSLHYLFLGAIVHGFEPSPFNHQSIERICGIFKDFTLHKVAVGYKNVIITTRFIDSHDGHNRRQKITFVRFDEYASQNGIEPKFIKMDIEGMEHYALHAMRHTIEEIQPYWQIEYHPNTNFWTTTAEIERPEPFDFTIFFDNYTVFDQKFNQTSKISEYGQYFFIPKVQYVGL